MATSSVASARRHGVHVVATFLETGAPDPFNAALLVDRDGCTALHHRKVHTCFFDVPEKACGRGDGFSTVSIATASGPLTVGIMVCMDREYAAAATALSQAGAEIALVPNCCELAGDAVVGDVRIAQA